MGIFTNHTDRHGKPCLDTETRACWSITSTNQLQIKEIRLQFSPGKSASMGHLRSNYNSLVKPHNRCHWPWLRREARGSFSRSYQLANVFLASKNGEVIIQWNSHTSGVCFSNQIICEWIRVKPTPNFAGMDIKTNRTRDQCHIVYLSYSFINIHYSKDTRYIIQKDSAVASISSIHMVVIAEKYEEPTNLGCLAASEYIYI